jgi:Major Facilitator Superfamily.
MRITTQQAKIPWSWAVCMMLPWTTLHYSDLLSGSPLTFTLRKFADQPALIAFLSSLNIAFNFIVGAIASYTSDRIWTRWGRRRPFLIVGWTGAAVVTAGIPLAPNLWILAGLVVLYQFFIDVAKPYEPLYNEVVPPSQRGRAGVLRSVATTLNGLVFNGVLLVNFDRNYGQIFEGWSFEVRGEHLIYWAGAVLTIVTMIFIVFAVREVPPRGGVVHERFRFGKFFRDVFADRRWWMVYALYACPMVSGAAARVFVPLTLTEQVGLTKAQFGWIETITMVANLVLFVPLSGYLADRFSRLKLMQIAMVGSAAVNALLFVMLRLDFVATPVVVAICLFSGVGGGFIALKYLIWGPLVYDFIPSDRFGTVSAGFSFVGGVAGFLMINLGGLWVQVFSSFLGSDSSAGFDYSSIFVLQFLLSFVAVWFIGKFAQGVREGRILTYGSQELEANGQGEK